MSFIKACFLAILATVFLTYVLGVTVTELLDINIYMGEQLLEPLKVVSVSALVAVLLVVAAIAIVVSVFGSIVFVVLLAFGGLALFFIGLFWPILLVIGLIWLVVRDKPAPQY